ncbi:MAG: Coenzyme F420 hydrogenase/dehydrogenase, beta subunit C-terminal domain [Sedimentisphaerales bacterium]|nr:Coenzyme F420 hydrogenase/dehydrogenase, beta subunit C-terminal domain [Sedimentisphaerales bacterium]
MTIKWVADHKLCTGCGICTAVCVHNALDMTTDESRGCFVPELREESCRHCGLCYQVCPGHGVDFDGLSRRLFGDIPSDIALGRYLATYVGHATDGNIRYDSASGGLVTALLIFALEHDLIDGALVTRMRGDDPLVPEPFIARTRKEILSAAGSKYCPVTIGAAVREVLDSRGRFAVVGLPCHIQGIRKAEQEIVELSGRIRYRISLACSLNYSFHGTRRLIESLGIAPQEVQELQYRGRGWPGTMQLRTRDGTETVVPLGRYYRQLGPYSLWRCLLCSDMLGELSDLSCGDAWLPELVKTDKAGSSFVISRSPEAEELLEAAAAREAVELSELGIPSLLASQGRALFKKRKLKARMWLARLCGRRVPEYRQKLETATLRDYVNTIKLFVARRALSGKHRVLRGLFNAIHRWKRKKRKETVKRETFVAVNR